MSNIIEYNELLAFHPGYYIAEIIEEMEISQVEFARRLGTTSKTMSQLVNGQCRLSNDLAQKLSIMLGTSTNLWLNLQSSYDEKLLEIQYHEKLDNQIAVIKQMDYSYFEKLVGFPKTKDVKEKIRNLCGYFKISDLTLLSQPDFLVNFRTGISNVQEKNIINAQAWLQTAINVSKNIETQPFDAFKLKSFLPEIRLMTTQEPNVFLPRLKEIFSECGVIFVLLPHLKNSGINGAVKWFSPDKVLLAINDRRCYADTFWFSLFHEIKHILQQKYSKVFISYDSQKLKELNDKLEIEADDFASNYLIPATEYNKFISQYISEREILEFACKLKIHPGIIVGRLQHDKIIPQNHYTYLKIQYKIIVTKSLTS